MQFFNKVVLFLVTVITITFSAEGKQNCDKLGINFYDNIGCSREHSEGDCPSYSGCNYTRPHGACTFRGDVIKDHEIIGFDKDKLCNGACQCLAPNNTKGIFRCPIVDCPEMLLPPQEGCYWVYEPNRCCGTRRCEPSEVSCVVDGVTYKEGKLFYPKDECSVCTCTSTFNGTYEGPNCGRRACDVEIYHSSKIERNCAPAYDVGEPNAPLCCPRTFICPSDEDKFSGSADSNSALTCRYGNKTVKPGLRLTREIERYGNKKTATCECKLPPLLTCTY